MKKLTLKGIFITNRPPRKPEVRTQLVIYGRYVDEKGRKVGKPVWFKRIKALVNPRTTKVE